MAELHKAKIDDMFTDDGVIRDDGLMQHSMYIMQVKTPAESKGAVGLLQGRGERCRARRRSASSRIRLPAGQEIGRRSPCRAAHGARIGPLLLAKD